MGHMEHNQVYCPLWVLYGGSLDESVRTKPGATDAPHGMEIISTPGRNRRKGGNCLLFASPQP